MRQRTIKDQIFISGKGIHTGLNTNLTLKPEKEGYGIKFKRTDLNPPVIIEASLSNVFDTQRSTSLKKNGAIFVEEISQINHKTRPEISSDEYKRQEETEKDKKKVYHKNVPSCMVYQGIIYLNGSSGWSDERGII